MADFTTFQTGGKALMAFPKTREQLQTLLVALTAKSLPFFMLGAGSNILAPDDGMDILMINTRHLNKIERQNNHLVVECGATLKDFCEFAKQQSLSGLEFACGIPGTVGGAVYMNAGAYEGEIAKVLQYSDVFLPEKQKMECFLAERHEFSYRYSRLMRDHAVVISSCFRLEEANQAQIQAKMDELTQKREEKQPLEYPSAGSTFKRPEGYFAGKLISDAELQGTNINGAEVSLKHAGFIINKGTAKTEDILALIDHVRNTVFAQAGVVLQPEVCILDAQGNVINLKEPSQ
ncbi:MAG: UDP-N-acetylmuramate dehydrogenase [Brevinema sp.]